MTRVGVAGASGQMGRLVAVTIASANNLELTACYDPKAAAGEEVSGVACSTDPDVLSTSDVIVEFTHPDVVMQNLRRWHDAGASAVVGTSGFDEARIGEVRALWANPETRCLIVPNFSIGAVLMMRMAELAAPFFAAADIIELHHDRKADAPSGTALRTAQLMAAAGARDERAVQSKELHPGATGAKVEGIPIHSVRLPGLVAHQQVTFGSEGETLAIRHDTTDRASFMPGVLLAVWGVSGLPPGVTVGLEPLLAID